MESKGIFVHRVARASPQMLFKCILYFLENQVFPALMRLFSKTRARAQRKGHRRNRILLLEVQSLALPKGTQWASEAEEFQEVTGGQGKGNGFLCSTLVFFIQKK